MALVIPGLIFKIFAVGRGRYALVQTRPWYWQIETNYPELMIIRTHDDARIWTGLPESDLGEAFAREPCVVCCLTEEKGESVAFDVGGKGSFYTLSEHGGESKVPLYFIERVE